MGIEKWRPVRSPDTETGSAPEGGMESAEQIHKEFSEKPSTEIQLFACHVARPDGFAKTLALGNLATSQELLNEFGVEFAIPHREYRGFGKHEANYNDYISLNIGVPQRLYQESNKQKGERDWRGGLGFVFPAEKLLAKENAKPIQTFLNIRQSVEKIKDASLFEDRFEPYRNLSGPEEWNLDRNPTKKDLLSLVHLARKANNLRGMDQAEFNLERSRSLTGFPRLSTRDGIVLIPQKARDAFERYLQKKIIEMQPFADKIKKVFDVDVQKLTTSDILQQSNIYWYPHANIREAVECLSAHPEIAKEFLPN